MSWIDKLHDDIKSLVAQLKSEKAHSSELGVLLDKTRAIVKELDAKNKKLKAKVAELKAWIDVPRIREQSTARFTEDKGEL